MDDQVNADANVANGADNLPAIGMISQYVKDLSFESPSAPAIFQQQNQPNIEVEFGIGVNKVADDVHETTLKIEVKAKTEEMTAFIVDLTFAALFGVRNVPDDQLQPFLLGEAPRLMFPFARRVVADAVRDGGFPPLTLDPIDFGSLYLQQLQAQEQAATEGAAGNA
ncbi:protein-export chaperone SecB [Sphingomonas panacisoli]|uniref:Protein-export protein SecB n=1 Tax=Sphingomonas panacisoli TaxID=1813879 RepID=A0A5B8LGH5_9SPHN|nr:protein-export chaperone SecB [Sphingomonas panacisoli]QDZ06986.1 protein-export chaperone SecB [Sphingomonas panacisoli]